MVAKRKPVAPPVAGIAWTDEEWQRLAPLMRQAVIDVLNGPSLQEQAAPAASPVLAAESSSAGAPLSPVVAPVGPPLPVRPPRKKLLVVGLLGSQQKEIMAGFADTFELRFLTQDDSSSRMEQHARSCDITIGMVGYMSHPRTGRGPRSQRVGRAATLRQRSPRLSAGECPLTPGLGRAFLCLDAVLDNGQRCPCAEDYKAAAAPVRGFLLARPNSQAAVAG